MRKVKISLPATITGIGPALSGLSLAVALRMTVEITERTDTQLLVEPTGEGAGRYSLGLRHPVVLGMIRVFQHAERAHAGFNVRIENAIPLDSGLGAEAAFYVAGIIGANNLLGNPLKRDQVLRLAADASRRPANAVTAVLGGLTATVSQEDTLIYRSLGVTPLRLVVAVPQIDAFDGRRNALPPELPLPAVLANLACVPLLVEALRAGDEALLAHALDDHLAAPHYHALVPDYDDLLDLARRHGALAVTFTGGGPGMVFFARAEHRRLADAVELAFRDQGVPARVWELPVDTQGVTVSVIGS